MGEVVEEVCDRCKTPVTVSVEYFQRTMKDGEPVLCAECLSAWMDEQTQVMPKRCFEYLVQNLEDTLFVGLGAEGWELVSVDNGIAYFKREYMKEG
jgi:hypothetical protein